MKNTNTIDQETLLCLSGVKMAATKIWLNLCLVTLLMALAGTGSAQTVVWYAADQTSNSGTSTNTQTVNKPSNVQEGDLIIVTLHYRKSSLTITNAQGFQLIRNETSGSDTDNRGTVAAFRKIATSSEPATYTFTSSGNDSNWRAVANRVTGHDPVSPIGNQNGSNSGSSTGTSRTVTSINTTVNGSLLVAAIAIRDDVTSFSNPTNMTASFTNALRTVANVSTQNITSAGATGDKTWSWTNSERNAALMFAINANNCPADLTLSGTSGQDAIINSTSTVTLSNTITAQLPVGNYVVTYNLSAPNAATSLTANMTITTAGTGTFTIPGSNLTNPGSTTITITQLELDGCPTETITTNNTDAILVTCPGGISITGISTTNVVIGYGMTVSLTNTTPANLPAETYTVTYNLSVPNAATGRTVTMIVQTSGSGQFLVPESSFTVVGPTMITITHLAYASCGNTPITSNNTKTFQVRTFVPECGFGPGKGCQNTDYSNTFIRSNSDAGTIEYNNYLSTYHSTIVRTTDGSFLTWGEAIGNDGVGNILSPQLIDATNYPALGTAELYKVAGGSAGSNQAQWIALASDGLYAWGVENRVLDGTLTSSTTFQKVTGISNANSFGLPTGVNPEDVRMIVATVRRSSTTSTPGSLMILTCDGEVWVISLISELRGNGNTGNSTSWYQVTTNETGNPFLTDVIVVRSSGGAAIALKSDGTLWTWGLGTFLGNNSASATQSRAIQMTAPTTGPIKMIGTAANGADPQAYFVLMTDGKLYTLGSNIARQLGDWSSSERKAWVQPLYASGGAAMNDIVWISPSETDGQYAGVNVINADTVLWAFGNSQRYMIGRGNGTANDPAIPGGLTAADKVTSVFTGGHTTMITKKCTSNFGYVGHRVRGSMGNGSPNDVDEANYSFATAEVPICGTDTPLITVTTSIKGASGKNCVGVVYDIIVNPVGGSITKNDPFSIATLSGNPTDGYEFEFSAPGSVELSYEVPNGGCNNPPLFVTTTVEAETCDSNLDIQKTVNQATPIVGHNVEFTLIAFNNGPQDNQNVLVQDLLPSGFTYFSHAASTGLYNEISGAWEIGDLAAAISETLTIVATVNDLGDHNNIATISGDYPDSDLGNNVDNASVTPQPIIDLVTENGIVSAAIGGTAITNVASNDMVNGVAATLGISGNATVAQSGSWPSGITLNTSTGAITVATGTTLGHYPVTYQLCDKLTPANCATMVDTIKVIPANTTYALGDFNNTPYESVAVGNVSTNDFDRESDSQVSFSLVGTNGGMPPAEGTVVLNISTGTYTYTPPSGFSGETSFSYEVCDDGILAACDTAIVYIEVLPPVSTAGSPIIANPDAITVVSGMTGTGTVLANDFDPDDRPFSVTTVLNMVTVSGVNEQGQVVADAGTLTLNANGSYVFVPTGTFTGMVVQPYTISTADSPAETDASVLEIRVVADSGNSTFANDDAVITDVGVAVSRDVLLNDDDMESDLHSVISYLYDSDGDGDTEASGVVGTATQIGGINSSGSYIPNAGSLLLEDDGSYTFTPAPSFVGNAVITYTKCDDVTPTPACDEATLLITVLGARRDFGDAPSNYPLAWHRALTDINTDEILDGTNDVWLGMKTSFEPSQKSNSSATGDNNDDAMTFGSNPGQFPTGALPLTNYSVDITVNSTSPGLVYYGLWIDWDNNGTYEAFYSGSQATSSPATATVTITTPAVVGAMVNVRLRADDNPLVAGDFQGGKTNGEVEDYQAVVMLPVELIGFEGKVDDCEVSLYWVSAAEENFSHYEIERSVDGNNFRQIGRVAGVSYSDINRYYEYKDDQAIQVNYYRLKIVDLDGSFEYSKMIYLATDCNDKYEMTAFPNPVGKNEGLLKVKFYSTEETANLEITDVLGGTVRVLNISVQKEWNMVYMDIMDLAAGTYFLKQKGNRKVVKFIIQD